MLKLGRMTDYGIVIMSALAVRPARVQSTSEISARTRLSQPTVRKLLKLLARSQLVDAVRGVQGGYRLKQPPDQITIAQIVDALEGPVALTECSGSHGLCALESGCSVRDQWQPINLAVQRALSAVTLAQMAPAPRPPLSGPPAVQDFVLFGPVPVATGPAVSIRRARDGC